MLPALLLLLAAAARADVWAGGAGYMRRFDHTRADVIALEWEDIPTQEATVEYWAKILDTHLTTQCVLAYSAYDAAQSPVYEQGNEFLLMLAPSQIRFFRGTESHDCVGADNAACDWNTVEWRHHALTWRASDGLWGAFADGQPVDLGFRALRDAGGDADMDADFADFSGDFPLAAGATEQTTTLDVAVVDGAADPCADDFGDAVTPGAAAAFALSGDCEAYDQAAAAVAAGAAAVLLTDAASAPAVPAAVPDGVVLEAAAAAGAGDDRCENAADEGPAQAFDYDVSTKWLSRGAVGDELTGPWWLEREFPASAPQTAVAYGVVAADALERAPRSWELQGSTDGGASWTALDVQSSVAFGAAGELRLLSIPEASQGPWGAFRLYVTEVQDADAQEAAQGVVMAEAAELWLFSALPADLADGDVLSAAVYDDLAAPVLALAASADSLPAQVDLFASYKYYGSDSYLEDLVPGGLLHLGQEADKYAGDFDELQAFDGLVDEFRVWSTVRSDADIAATFDRGLAGDEADLALYWRLDESGGDEAADASGRGNVGMVGQTPDLTGQLSYATDRGNVLPTAPDAVPSTAPLISRGGDVVLYAAADGGDTVVALPAASDAPNDTVTITLSDLPTSGSVWLSDGATEVTAAGTEVGASVIYRGDGATFNFTATSVADPAQQASARVVLLPYAVDAPAAGNYSLDEDSLSLLTLSALGPDGDLLPTVVDELPAAGQLFQVNFTVGATPTYTSVVSDPEYRCLEPVAAGDELSSYRGLALYLPAADDSAADGQVYAAAAVQARDPATNATSAAAEAQLFVAAVNDAPTGQDATVDASAGQVRVALQTADVDANFAPRLYTRLTQFPLFGDVLQGDDAGTPMDLSVTRVPTVFSWAAEVLGFSSQYSLCEADCYSFNNPECSFTQGLCTEDAWHASQVLGEPDVYPDYKDAKNSWDLSTENAGDEWIELAFSDAVFVEAVEIYETYKPGAVVSVQTTAAWEGNEFVGSPDATVWAEQWAGAATVEADEARVYSPPLCPPLALSDAVRVELDTATTVGWNNYDAVKVTGSLDFPPGRVTADDNAVVYVPMQGLHAFGERLDDFSYAVSDCEDESPDAYTVTVELAAPAEALSEAPWGIQLVNLLPREWATVTVDLGPLFDDLAPRLASRDIEVGELEVEVHATSSSVSTSLLEAFTLDVAHAANATFDLDVRPGSLSSAGVVELWVSHFFGVTYRQQLIVCKPAHMALESDRECRACDSVTTDMLATASDQSAYSTWCSAGLPTRAYEVPAAAAAVLYSFTGLALLYVLVVGAVLFKNRTTKVVRYAQVNFCLILLFGIALGLVVPLVDAGGVTDFSCAAQAVFGHVGFAITLGAVSAKIWRINKITLNAKLRRLKLDDSVLLGMLARATVPVVIYIIIWMALDPPRAVPGEDQLTEEEDDVTYELLYDVCKSEHDNWHQFLLVVEAVALGVAVYLSWRNRLVPTDFNESHFVGLAIYNIALASAVVLAIRASVSDMTPTFSLMLIGLSTCMVSTATVSVLFVPKLWALKTNAANVMSSNNSAGGSGGGGSGAGSGSGGAAAGGGGGATPAEVKELKMRIYQLEQELRQRPVQEVANPMLRAEMEIEMGAVGGSGRS